MCNGISKAFGTTTVLDGVDLDIRDGEFVALLGPSGCGKTTLLRILAGLDTQDRGEVRIGGIEISDLAPKRRDVAMVFQSYALYPYMTVAENIALPLVMRRLGTIGRLPLVSGLIPSARQVRRGIANEVQAVANSLGIGQLLARRPVQLSGGQRQRVALARAMVRRPSAFLMDEPLSNLDAKMRVQARAEIADLHRRLGATFIYVTHDQVEAMTMADRVAVMRDGRILQVDTPQALYENPTDQRVALFVGTPEINLLAAETSGDGGLTVAGRSWPLRLAAAAPSGVTVAVRPEAWMLSGAPGQCEVAGVVRHIEHLGSDTFIHVEIAASAARIIARLDPIAGARLGHGAAVTLSASPSRVLAFGDNGKRIKVEVLPPAVIAAERAQLRAAADV